MKCNAVITILFNTVSLTHASWWGNLAEVVDTVHYHYVNKRQKIRESSGDLEPQHSPSIQSKHMLLLFINTIFLHHAPVSWVQSGINLSPDPEANELHMMINLIWWATQVLLIHYHHCIGLAHRTLPPCTGGTYTCFRLMLYLNGCFFHPLTNTKLRANCAVTYKRVFMSHENTVKMQ